MKKPELVVTSSPDDDFLVGHCSSCQSIEFKLQGNTLQHKTLLRRIFDQHFKRVHLRETPAKPLLGSLRKATED